MLSRVTAIFLLLAMVCPMLVSAAVFSDVPAGHPALQAIEKLAAAGIVTGVDGRVFAGKRSISRYEMAMVVFRTMARLEEQITADSPAISQDALSQIDYLKNELVNELEMLGLRVEINQNRRQMLREEVDRLRDKVAALKKDLRDNGEKVALAGDWLTRHTWKSHRDDYAKNSFTGVARPGNSNNSLTETQVRIRSRIQIDDNVSLSTRFRIFNRGSDEVNGAQSQLGGAFGRNGIGGDTRGDFTVDAAYLEIKKVFHDDDWFLIGRSTAQNGHGLLLNADFDALRYNRLIGDRHLSAQYIFDRHRGSFRDDAAVDFRGVANLNFSRHFNGRDYYIGLYAQDEPDLLNRRRPGTINHGIAAGEQKSDGRRDMEMGFSGRFGGKKKLTADLAVALTDYTATINKPAAGSFSDVRLRGTTGLAALGWRAGRDFSARLAYSFADDEFAGAYALNLDRRYSDNIETNLEDIARGNDWFKNGLSNMGAMKFQTEYKPRGRHYFRVAVDYLRELKDYAVNDLSHRMAGNPDGVIPAGYMLANSAYDNFNNIGVADPKLQIINFEYRYRLTEHTRLRIGAVKCDFRGDAFKKVGGARPIAAGRGFKDDYDYKMIWVEIFNRF